MTDATNKPLAVGLDVHAIAKDAAERVHTNGGCVPQLAYAPILWALQDAFALAAPAEGYVLVPVEPTEAMLDAGDRAMGETAEMQPECPADPRSCWDAMIAACLPAAPTGEGKS